MRGKSLVVHSRTISFQITALLAVMLSALMANTLRAAPILAEAGGAVRVKDGSINIPATIAALQREHVNTYLYQIWRYAGDWDQLPAFADAAKKANIDVWVYLVPWSETPVKDRSFPYPLPFKTNYIAWADAIGKLSLDHPAIAAWVMDDFYINATQPTRFTDNYVTQMLSAGKAQNPDLKFYPVVYFQQPWADFVSRFGRKIDGVIACYPRSTDEVDEVRDYLSGDAYGPSLLASLSRKAKIKAGDQAVAIAQLHVPSGSHLRFYFDDQTFGGETGEHTAFANISGGSMWTRRVSSDKENESVDLPLPDSPNDLTIRVGIQVDKTETGALVQARFDDLHILNHDGARIECTWRELASPGTNATLTPPNPGGGNLHLPMLLLVATLPAEHTKRYDEPATPENIQKKLRLALDCVDRHAAAGVVCWYTPKAQNNQILAVVGQEFARTEP